jgi:hypothetical protein
MEKLSRTNSMIWFHIMLLFPLLSTAYEHDEIQEHIKPGTITFIGETHQHAESVLLIKRLIEASVNDSQCPILALEIDDRQQGAIDKVMTYKGPIRDIVISSIIDHRHYRRLFKHLARLKFRHPCLEVRAIDTGIDTPYERNEWMAKNVAAMSKERPIVVLVGSHHTLKAINWLTSKGKPSAAEILHKQGFLVKSFPQIWIPKKCDNEDDRAYRFVSIDKPEALTLLVDDLFATLNAKEPEQVEGVVDGLILWACDNLTRD